jgi:ABC-type lipoprotein release transport system permease subunit
VTPRRLVLRSLRHYWRTHLGIVLGAAIGTAVLVGALLVGDSVRHSLHRQALARIGSADLVLASHDRFFRAALAEEILPELPPATRIAPVLLLRGIASTFDQARRANGVMVHGVDERFFALAPGGAATGPGPAAGEAWLNRRLADRLGAGAGDSIVVRVEQPSALPRDMVLATTHDTALALRVAVTGVVDDAGYGRFSLAVAQVPPASVFLDLAWLQERLERPGRANLMLAGGTAGAASPVTAEAADAALRRRWRPADAELAVRPTPGGAAIEVVSDRIFIDEPVAAALVPAGPPLTGVLTYFVNELRSGDRATPYSMVTGVGALAGARDAAWSAVVPGDMGDDEIVVGSWLADDLGAGPGDPLRLTYFVLGTAGRFEERSRTFRVRDVVAMEGPAADRTLMPEFPGIADAESSRDWEPGIPIDLGRIRDADEAYWREHRGTPKAFVTLAAARAMWENRFGTLTAVRAPPADGPRLVTALEERLDPASVGLGFRDLRGAALAAGTSTTDFGGLFIGLSLFLIVAALLLTALLFVFGVEQRSEEIGTLLAVGYRPRAVRRLLLGEAAVLALAGGVIGVAAGVGYTRLVLLGLATVWREAVALATLELHVSAVTIAAGGGGAVIAAWISIAIALRRQVRRPASVLLAGGGGAPPVPPRTRARQRRVGLVVAAACVVAALALVVLVGGGGSESAGLFFGVGALLLTGTLAATGVGLARIPRAADVARLTVGRLGLRNSLRRRGRSLATVALLAAGSFLVVAVGANRLEAGRDAWRRAGGTGGFALVGESTLGVVHDLDTADGREAFGLTAEAMADVAVVGLRVRDGDDASCLNLGVAQEPRLLGVDPAALADRDAFRFARGPDDPGLASPWELLRADAGPDDRVVPAIGDQASVQWALHKKVGDTIAYVDERGAAFEVRIVATVANSILQGSLIIDRDAFERLYPSESGSRLFLIDAPRDRMSEVSATLGRALSDVGLELTPAATRLAEFNSVQNTYLVIFQMLGGLGLLLGSAGLGMVVLRNVLERRRELALLRAVGFPARSVRWIVMSEHGLLLALGLGCGAASALVAVLPALLDPRAEASVVPTAIVLAAVGASGVGWVWVATRLAVRGAVLAALRDE